jgi:hypothetical protein
MLDRTAELKLYPQGFGPRPGDLHRGDRGLSPTKSVWINNDPGGGNPFIMKTAS